METYLALELIWWLLLGVLLAGIAIMVGMDMGVGTILRYVGRSDVERRVALNIIGPHWDGNQVWFVLGGGAIFAAWPRIYATAFSALYVVMLVLLWSMMVRPLGFEYRGKLQSLRWRNGWDWVLFVSGFVPMLVFGAAMGNVLQGIAFHFEWNLASRFDGSFLALVNPVRDPVRAAVGGDVDLHGRDHADDRRRRRTAQARGDDGARRWHRCARAVHRRRVLGERDAGLPPRPCARPGTGPDPARADGRARATARGSPISVLIRSSGSFRR